MASSGFTMVFLMVDGRYNSMVIMGFKKPLITGGHHPFSVLLCDFWSWEQERMSPTDRTGAGNACPRLSRPCYSAVFFPDGVG